MSGEKRVSVFSPESGYEAWRFLCIIAAITGLKIPLSSGIGSQHYAGYATGWVIFDVLNGVVD